MSSMIAADDVRARISTELALLRSLTQALLSVARSAEHDERQRQVLRDVLAHVCAEVERHFEYEEEIIAPLLREVDAWGAVRVEQLLKAHEEQRLVLVALVEDADDGMLDIEDLVDEIVWFFQRFEQEMVAEEERLLSAESVGAEPLVDQIDG